LEQAIFDETGDKSVFVVVSSKKRRIRRLRLSSKNNCERPGHEKIIIHSFILGP
jgi:hypothetical protein